MDDRVMRMVSAEERNATASDGRHQVENISPNVFGFGLKIGIEPNIATPAIRINRPSQNEGSDRPERLTALSTPSGMPIEAENNSASAARRAVIGIRGRISSSAGFSET